MGHLLTLVADPGRATVAHPPPAGYELRRCRPADVPRLGRLYFEAYDAGVAARTVEAAVADMQAAFAGEYGELWPPGSLVATDGCTIVGAVQTVRRAPWADTPDGPFVIELFTARDHRRRGLGRALLAAAMAAAAAAGSRQVGLRVDVDNGPARSLYARLGFGTAVRPARSTDAADVARIYVESWNAGFGPLMRPQALDQRQVARWAVELDAARTRWWVAVRDGDVVGFAGAGPSRDPVDPCLGELDTIAVDPCHWRGGVGRSLLSVAVHGLARQGNRSAILWTLAGYERAQRFYAATGWAPDGGTRDGGRQVSYRRDLDP